ncbi:MAG: hypothetical protein WA376_09605, partial [Terrimicrobiaceae bacterium]
MVSKNNQRNKQDERSGPEFKLKLPRLNAVADFSEGRFLVHDEHDEALGWMTVEQVGSEITVTTEARVHIARAAGRGWST